MIMTMNLAWFSSLFSWSTLGYILLTIGVIATLLSPYRFLLGYLLAGMAYWFVVDILQSALLYMFTIDSWQGYIYSLGITWLVLGAWFIYRLNQHHNTSPIPTKSLDEKHEDTYIEHTPIYKDYQPRFHKNNHFNAK